MQSSNAILHRYKHGQRLLEFGLTGRLKEPNGYFRFGPDVICYGQTTGKAIPAADGTLFDASKSVERRGGDTALPFDYQQVVDNLWYERYIPGGARSWAEKSWPKRLYYGVRPILPDFMRRRVQKMYLLRQQRTATFPSWPVDRTVDVLLEKVMILGMRATQADRIPFIWFWPHGYKSAAIMTHDVETEAGRNFSDDVMDLDDSFGIKSSFQIVPEKRYAVPTTYLETMRDRGFEVNVHGLDHEGDLFENRKRFVERAKRINEYAGIFRSRGFRSPCLYRNPEWLRELNFSYDMSVPNVAHLEVQRGGCCTVMPYALPGGMLELPLTTTEDYTLFHILKDYSINLWKQQMRLILEGHGLMHFLVHPDYVIPERAWSVYKVLLEEICRLRSNGDVWLTLPGEIERWWRERDQMGLVQDGNTWKIEGNGSQRAVVAYACLDGDRLSYEFNARIQKECRGADAQSGRAAKK